MSESKSVLTREEGLEINVVDDGFVVYQPSHDRMHYLNHTAGLLLELCNGSHSEADLVAKLRRAYSLPADPADEVASCLEQLRAQELIC